MKKQLSRPQASTIVGIIAWGLGVFSVLSFNEWQHVRLFGSFTPFDLITDAVTNVFLPVGGIFYALFAGWIMKTPHTMEAFNLKSKVMYHLWLWLIRIICHHWQSWWYS